MMDFVERGKEEKERMGDMTGGEKAADYSSNVTPMQPYNTTQCTKKQTMQQTQILNTKQSKMQNDPLKQRKMDTSYPLCIPEKIGAIVMDSFPFDIIIYQNILSPSCIYFC